ncbi:septum site-determining protein MinC [Spongiibacter sp. KMU-166]|uniref:Probable septum site-determining protein MinC n=1 Tax=Spongiibacter thalassae TaxID=2721624 RepID=A0ABX1GJE4_9GAMM|nr:septum site-determining protein MinC [Spongiibacter thalassae]NKI18513.1 septum site-determining protein MinC [Spongiibacter thalassae]
MDSKSQNAELPFASTAQFRLKAGLFPLTQLDISHYERDAFTEQLAQKAAEAPAFFQHTPVVLNFDTFEGTLTPPLGEICGLCREHGLMPAALRSGDDAILTQATDLALAIMPAGKTKVSEVASTAPPAPDPAPAKEEAPSPEPLPSAGPTKVVNTPIRSGQQVYAAGGDLIVLSSVSAGAEVLADGNIHVYGALRGRALAGVRGDTSARIFCQSLEAELVSIAGNFKLDEDMRAEHWKAPRQIHLDEQTLVIQPLS